MTVILEKRRKTALHEAAHVVVGRAAGLTVRKAEIYEDGNGACWTELSARNSRESLKKELAYVLAGRLATALEADEPVYSLNLRDIVDREVVADSPGAHAMRLRGFRRSLVDIYGSEQAAERWLDVQLPVIAKETCRVLRKRWAEVTDLATRLLQEGEINFMEDELHARPGYRRLLAKYGRESAPFRSYVNAYVNATRKGALK